MLPPAFGASRSDSSIQQRNDTLTYTGTGVILAMAVDADDNLIFTMEDAPTVSGGVFFLQMEQGGRTSHDSDDLGDGISEPAGLNSESSPAVALAVDLGPFLPGVAVCPATGDIYVTRGHTGMARLVKGVNGDFGTKVRSSIVAHVSNVRINRMKTRDAWLDVLRSELMLCDWYPVAKSLVF